MAETPPQIATVESIIERCKPHDSGIHTSRVVDLIFSTRTTDSTQRFMAWDEMRVMPEYEWRRGSHAHVNILCKELLGGKLQHEDIFLSYAANTIKNFVMYPSPDAPRMCDLVLIRDTLMCHYPDHEVTAAARDAVPYSRRVIFNEPEAS